MIHQLDILFRRELAHCPQIQEQAALQLAAQLPALLAGRAGHRHTGPLLRAEQLGALNQLLELRQPEPFSYCVRLVSPQKIADSLRHLQPSP